MEMVAASMTCSLVAEGQNGASRLNEAALETSSLGGSQSVDGPAPPPPLLLILPPPLPHVQQRDADEGRPLKADRATFV